MIRLCSYFVFILVINLLQFNNGSLAVEQLSTSEETCDLPCVDKIADRISKHAEGRYTALEISIIEKLELQLTRMEQFFEERITRIETYWNQRIPVNVGIVHNHEESYQDVQTFEHNTIHQKVLKELVVIAAEKNTTLAEQSTLSSTSKPEKITEIPNLSERTPDQPEDCVESDNEATDFDEDYAQQFIEARVGSTGKKLCVEASTTLKPSSMPSVFTEGSTTVSSSSFKENMEGSNNFVTQSSVSEKPVYNEELDNLVSVDNEEPTTVPETDQVPFYSQTVEEIPKVFPDGYETKETSTELIPHPPFEVTPETTTERISTSTHVDDNINQEVEQIVFIPEVELLKPTAPPKKKFQPWIRTSSAKPKFSNNPTTTEDPNTYKIHFPTESPEPDRNSTPKVRPVPKPPQAFGYARNYLNGSWTIIHSRNDGSVSFNRSWTEYRTQFGRLPGEYWMGLEAIHQLTKAGDYELLVVLKGFDGTVKIAMYDSFWVGSEASNYRLALGPFVGGTAGDSFSAASGQMFSTYDRDNDRSLCASCSEMFHSGWWFKDCADANLNGLYVSSMESEEKSYGTSMNWWSFNRDYQGLQEAAMLIRKRGRKLA